jgi:hypothetical protein
MGWKLVPQKIKSRLEAWTSWHIVPFHPSRKREELETEVITDHIYMVKLPRTPLNSDLVNISTFQQGDIP